MQILSQKALMMILGSMSRKRTPFAGLRVILYLRAGTDSAQPIRVVRDSYVKGLNQ